MRPAVVTGKYLPHVLVGVFLGESGTVDRGWIAASLRVDEELGVRHVPWYRARRFRHKLLERELRVVDSDLMTTKRGTSTTYDDNDMTDHVANDDAEGRDRPRLRSPSLQLAHEQFFRPSA